MTSIFLIADLCDANIHMHYCANQDGRWCARFEYGDVKEGSLLRGSHGNGTTPRAALEDYCQIIAGKMIIWSAGTDREKVYVMPRDLGVPDDAAVAL